MPKITRLCEPVLPDLPMHCQIAGLEVRGTHIVVPRYEGAARYEGGIRTEWRQRERISSRLVLPGIGEAHACECGFADPGIGGNRVEMRPRRPQIKEDPVRGAAGCSAVALWVPCYGNSRGKLP